MKTLWKQLDAMTHISLIITATILFTMILKKERERLLSNDKG